jgi:hypothetical protein
MIIDSIVAEVRAHREAIFEECGHDLDQFEKRARQNSALLKSKGWLFADRPTARVSSPVSQTTDSEPSLLMEDPPPPSLPGTPSR